MPVKIVDKGENTGFERVKTWQEKCWLPAFSPFSNIFSAILFQGVVESQECGNKTDKLLPSDISSAWFKLWELEDNKLTVSK